MLLALLHIDQDSKAQPHFHFHVTIIRWPFFSQSSPLSIIDFWSFPQPLLNTITLFSFHFFQGPHFLLLPCAFPSPLFVHPIFISHTHSYSLNLTSVFVFLVGLLVFFFPSSYFLFCILFQPSSLFVKLSFFPKVPFHCSSVYITFTLLPLSDHIKFGFCNFI